MTKILQHPVYELFYDATYVDALLFVTQLVVKYYFMVFSHIPRHAGFICVHELAASSDRDDQIFMDEHVSVVVGLVSFYKFLELLYSGLERKQERQLFQKMFNSDRSLPKQKILQLIAQIFRNKNLRFEFISPENLLVQIGQQTNNSFELNLIPIPQPKRHQLLPLLLLLLPTIFLINFPDIHISNFNTILDYVVPLLH